MLCERRHVETVVSLSHKNADSHIHVNIEFGEGDGKIPVDKIAQKAFKVPDKSFIKLDKHGSFVWKCIDGNKSVYELSKDVKTHFGNDAEPLIERLIEFITILESNRFVKFKKGGK